LQTPPASKRKRRRKRRLDAEGHDRAEYDDRQRDAGLDERYRYAGDAEERRTSREVLGRAG
jgi:hypothetical protein